MEQYIKDNFSICCLVSNKTMVLSFTDKERKITFHKSVLPFDSNSSFFKMYNDYFRFISKYGTTLISYKLLVSYGINTSNILEGLDELYNKLVKL